MSERFGTRDHDQKHDEPPQSTTPQGKWANIGGGDADSNTAPQAASGTRFVAGSGAYVSHANVPLDPLKKTSVAVALAMVFGPLGLFYVGLLHGIVALFTVVPIARSIGLNIAFALGGRIDPLYVVIPIIWCMTVPWAIVGTAARNRKSKT